MLTQRNGIALTQCLPRQAFGLASPLVLAGASGCRRAEPLASTGGRKEGVLTRESGFLFPPPTYTWEPQSSFSPSQVAEAGSSCSTFAGELAFPKARGNAASRRKRVCFGPEKRSTTHGQPLRGPCAARSQVTPHSEGFQGPRGIQGAVLAVPARSLFPRSEPRRGPDPPSASLPLCALHPTASARTKSRLLRQSWSPSAI